MPDVKMATCCYCSRRTVLRKTANDGHELACGSCGAPLHKMKSLRVAPARAPIHNPSAAKAKPARRDKPKKKKKKSLLRWAVAEIIDELEDIFD